MAESVDGNIQPEDKKVVVEDKVTTSYSPSPKAPAQTLDPMPTPQPSAEDESNQGDEIDVIIRVSVRQRWLEDG
ncbi:hypothetical protein CRENBAI_004009 [Crenichthys baileyi]|uniref:Uncharacterized protein n=1 Tax=Crenichthys baileyi TaxID=28760 RepID=A0AAV9RCC7_9TELE